MTQIIDNLATKLFELFIINKRYFALQKDGVYFATNQYINKATIKNVLSKKESFLAYQEDYNYIQWICFDFDVNKALIDSKVFEENKQELYLELLISIKSLTNFLDVKNIDYLLEFSGNRGIHLWICFDTKITRQDGFLIFETILEKSNLKLDLTKFSLDKYPKSQSSSIRTDKGTGVKIPLSFHQKSKAYSFLLTDISNFDAEKNKIISFTETFLEEQLKILSLYKKQNKIELIEKLAIKDKHNQYEKQEDFLLSKYVNFSETTLYEIIEKLNSCKHLKTLFQKATLNKKERILIVGLLAQLKKGESKVGKKLLFEYFSKMQNARPKIIQERLLHAERMCPPTCTFLRKEFLDKCTCDSISQTPLEYLSDFTYGETNFYSFDYDLFNDIRKAQLKYTKQNDEIALYHTINSLKKSQFELMKDFANKFITDEVDFQSTYEFKREEANKIRTLYSLNARDKIITTYGIKVLDSIFYKEFSLRSYGYKFNSSFRQSEIFESWFKQWNIYINELKSLIYADDFSDYYILKLDLKSYYDSISLGKLQIELKHYVEETFKNHEISLNEKNILNTVVNNLIKLTTNITSNNEYGLPQGPAYSRYLAEYYLTSLDKLIEQNIIEEGFYFRYVDDIFIIMPSKESIDYMENMIQEHLNNKYLTINENKKYKGRINIFKNDFETYINTTKYFIDNVSKNIDTRPTKMIQQASSELLELIKNKDETINDSNLSFLFTHLKDSTIVNDEKNLLEPYIIKEAKGRGTFFNIFWTYYFNKYEFETIDFFIFNELYGLKRETFLNSIIMVLKSLDIVFIQKLKDLLDFFILKTEVSRLEKLLLMEIYVLNNGYFEATIIKLVNDDIDLYDNLFMSDFKKGVIPSEILKEVLKNLPEHSEEKQFDYLFNILLLSDMNDKSTLRIFSKYFIDLVTTIISQDTRTNIDYLSINEKAVRYIQLVYISVLYYEVPYGQSFLHLVTPLWNNLFFNLSLYSYNIFTKKLSNWIRVVQKTSLEETNLHNLFILLKNDEHYKLTNSYSDKDNLIGNYYDSLIEIIYLEYHSDDTVLEELEDIKQYLIEKKNVKYLEWLNVKENVSYPTYPICLQNSLYNNFTVLKRDNEILIRFEKDELLLKKELSYLPIIHESIEDIFNNRYKTIIYQYNINEYDRLNLRQNNFFEVIHKTIQVSKNLQLFTDEYYQGQTFINMFYDNFYFHKLTEKPLIPLDGMCNYFVKQDLTFDRKDYNTYSKNILQLLEQVQIDLLPSNESGVFHSFKEDFFPIGVSDKLRFLELFDKNISSNIPNNIFDLETSLCWTIWGYLETKSILNFFELYYSYKRKFSRYYLIFNPVEELNDTTLENLFDTIKNSLELDFLNDELIKYRDLLIQTFGQLDQFKKVSLNTKYEDDEFLIDIEGTVVTKNDLETYNIYYDNIVSNSSLTVPQIIMLEKQKLYVSYQNGKHCIVPLPDLLIKVYNNIVDRNKAYLKSEYQILFKNVIPFPTLKEEGDFSKAIDVLINHYKYSEHFNANNLEEHLYYWLYPFKSLHEKRALLYIIANHQSFTNADINNFMHILCTEYMNKDYLITTLKNPEENNGTHRLITLKTDYPDLWRDLELIQMPQKLIKTKQTKIVFLTDIIISGSQVVKSFEKYYLKKDSINKKDSYYILQPNEFDAFKEKLFLLDEIIFLSAAYTKHGEEKIRNYFKEIGYTGNIIFKGNDKEYSQCVYSGLLNTKYKSVFEDFVTNQSFVNTHFITKGLQNYEQYSEITDNKTKFDNRNIFVRYNSMTKKRFFLFTLEPKYYRKPLFMYRND